MQKRIGFFPKDKAIGKFGEEWDKVWGDASAAESYEAIDVGPAFGALWAVKDEEELVSWMGRRIRASGF